MRLLPTGQSINQQGCGALLALARPMVLSTGDGVIDMDAEAARNGSTWKRANRESKSPYWGGLNWTVLHEDVQLLV